MGVFMGDAAAATGCAPVRPSPLPLNLNRFILTQLFFKKFVGATAQYYAIIVLDSTCTLIFNVINNWSLSLFLKHFFFLKELLLEI